MQNMQNIDMQNSKISESESSINSRTCLGHLVLFPSIPISYPSFYQMKSFCRYTWWVLMFVPDLGPLIGTCAPPYSWASGRVQCFTNNGELPT